MKVIEFFRNAVARFLVLFICFSISASHAGGQNAAFLEAAKKRVHKEFGDTRPKLELAEICAIDSDPLARRVFWEYGSIFVADGDVRLPDKCIFTSSALVDSFQVRLETKKAMFGSVEIELQESAMEHLLKAVRDAARSRLSITPLHGAIAGRRNYEDTVRLWNSRFYRALDHWSARGSIKRDEAGEARSLPIDRQIKKVLEWESTGIYFSTNFSKSIFYSVAPPGTSQHLSLLAFDVVEADDHRVRAFLNKHGWFQTIRTDKPHFTFLGVSVSDLPNRGLRNIYYEGNSFWVPSIEPIGSAQIVP